MRLFRSIINLTNITLVMAIATIIALPVSEKAYAEVKKDATEWIRQGQQLWQKNDL